VSSSAASINRQQPVRSDGSNSRHDHGSSRLREKLNVELQSRTPGHCLGRGHPETAAGHGRMKSTSQSHQKGRDYRMTRLTLGSYLRQHRPVELRAAPNMSMVFYGAIPLSVLSGLCVVSSSSQARMRQSRCFPRLIISINEEIR
jgi:hypothetical protein